MPEEADLAGAGFPELVERAREAADEVCEKAKLVLRPLLPGVQALQKDNAHFSLRLMLLMLSRTGDALSGDDRRRLHDILQHAEAFEPQLMAWMMAVEKCPGDRAGQADVQACTRSLDLIRSHLSELDRLVAKTGGGRHTG